jgi:hypothetical protein
MPDVALQYIIEVCTTFSYDSTFRLFTVEVQARFQKVTPFMQTEIDVFLFPNIIVWFPFTWYRSTELSVPASGPATV